MRRKGRYFHARVISHEGVSNSHKQKVWAQLFKTNDVVSQCIVETLIIKYGIYVNLFAENFFFQQKYL